MIFIQSENSLSKDIFEQFNPYKEPLNSTDCEAISMRKNIIYSLITIEFLHLPDTLQGRSWNGFERFGQTHQISEDGFQTYQFLSFLIKRAQKEII